GAGGGGWSEGLGAEPAILRSAGPLAVDPVGRIVALAAGHQLPGDAHGLVGERHRRQLGRLALEQRGEPRRGYDAASPDLLDIGGGAADQHRPQALVAGPGDAAQPLLAAARMVLRRQADPSRAQAAGAEAMRIDDLGDHQAGPDRADDR